MLQAKVNHCNYYDPAPKNQRCFEYSATGNLIRRAATNSLRMDTNQPKSKHKDKKSLD